jgi:hypothetical protein
MTMGMTNHAGWSVAVLEDPLVGATAAVAVRRTPIDPGSTLAGTRVAAVRMPLSELWRRWWLNPPLFMEVKTIMREADTTVGGVAKHVLGLFF